jgi:hypothetical protein
MARASLVALLLTVLFGGSLGVLRTLAGADYFLAWRQFPHRISWGIVELLVSAILMAVYAITYPRQTGRSRLSSVAHRLLAVFAATNLMYHVPPLLAAIADVAQGQVAKVEEADAVREWILSSMAMAKTLHFSLAALFVACVWGILSARSNEAVQWTARLAAATIVWQWPVGFWLVTTLKSGEQRRLMGESPLHTALLIAGLLASVMVLFQLLELGSDPGNQQQRRRVGVTSVCLILAMVGLLM